MTLSEFLLARIAEDEHAAMVARPDEHSNVRDRSSVTTSFDAAGYAFVRAASGRVARDCSARRRIIEREGSGDLDDIPTLRDLAAVYADHPDYDDTWRP